MNESPFYNRCIREHHGGCAGRITREHALIYSGRQMQEVFAIIPLCERHHGVCQYQGNLANLDKRFNEWVAISRMTQDDMEKYPRQDWLKKKKWLDSIYLEENSIVILKIENENSLTT